MDKMPAVGDVIRFNGYYGRLLIENLIENLSEDLLRWEYVEDAFAQYVRNVRKKAGIIDDRT